MTAKQTWSGFQTSWISKQLCTWFWRMTDIAHFYFVIFGDHPSPPLIVV
jgi:hypothetical protein